LFPGGGHGTGLSRPPSLCLGKFYQLGHFCRVVRGVASGANDFFFLSKARAAQVGMPKDYLIQAIIRMRDISGDEITTETIAALDCRASRAANIPAFHQPTPRWWQKLMAAAR